MNKIIIFSSLIISNLIFSQSLDNLDKKNGFRHLKFGSSPNQIKDLKIIKDEINNPNGVNAYWYTGNDIDYLFGIKVEEINLYFFNNQLFQIVIFFMTKKLIKNLN